MRPVPALPSLNAAVRVRFSLSIIGHSSCTLQMIWDIEDVSECVVTLGRFRTRQFADAAFVACGECISAHSGARQRAVRRQTSLAASANWSLAHWMQPRVARQTQAVGELAPVRPEDSPFDSFRPRTAVAATSFIIQTFDMSATGTFVMALICVCVSAAQAYYGPESKVSGSTTDS